MKSRNFLRRRYANGFLDRQDAGEALAAALSEFTAEPDLLVIGLARGGVPVAAVVADRLGATLEVAVVRKLGVPGHEELALGAITRDRMVVNDRLIADLGVGQQDIEAIVERERQELDRREIAYRQGRPPVPVAGRTVLLVDDGVATGATMRVAVLATRDSGAARVIVGVPTAPATVSEVFDGIADDVVCVHTPRPFYAVGQSYRQFGQVPDADVTAALARG
ncbi:MAG: phosphoribosyltransferase family protein [Mycobacterium sp.]